jgi:hypothetical protein
MCAHRQSSTDDNFLELLIDPGSSQSSENLFNGHEASLRLDYVPRSNDRFFTRLNWAVAEDEYIDRTLRGFASPLRSTTRHFQVSFLHTLAPGSVNEFRAAYSRDESITTRACP